MREKFGFLVTLAIHDLWLPCWMVRYKNILVTVESSTGPLQSRVKQVLCVWQGCWLHPCLCVITDWNAVMLLFVIVVQSLSCVRLFATPWTAVCQASLSFTISWSLLKLMSIESVMPSQPSHPLLFPSPPALNLAQHQSVSQLTSSKARLHSQSLGVSVSSELWVLKI